MLRTICLMAALSGLAACSNETPTATPIQTDAAPTPPDATEVATPAADVPALAVDGEGLRLFNKQRGSASSIKFGTPRDDVIQMLAFLGKPETGQNGECGAGPLDFANWANGFGLFFQQGKLVGWNLIPGGDVTTASGIGPGSSRADLEGPYAAKISETSLGAEFAAGELYGLLDGKGPSAKITYLWGGVSCNFR